MIILSISQFGKVFSRQMHRCPGTFCICHIHTATKNSEAPHQTQLRSKIGVNYSRMKTNSLDIGMFRDSSRQLLRKQHIHKLREGILLIWPECLVLAFNVLSDLVWCVIMCHWADVDDTSLRAGVKHFYQQVSQVEWSKMVDGKCHLNIVLISRKVINDQSCVVNQDVNVLECNLDFLDKFLYGLFLWEI